MNMMLPAMMMGAGISMMGWPRRVKLALTPLIVGSIMRTIYPPAYTQDTVLDVAISQLDTIH